MSADASGGEQERSGGLFNSLRTMAATMIAIVQTRAELLSTELEEERIRLTSMLAWSLVTLFCAVLGVIFTTLLFVLALWDSHRLLAVGMPAALFLLAAFFAWRVVLDKVHTKPRLFSASITELRKDREHLTPRP
ncbi:MAG: phage holin family protein [Sideroxydans sp.]|nr:phage holin family protein [Sideroxydans sp.]